MKVALKLFTAKDHKAKKKQTGEVLCQNEMHSDGKQNFFANVSKADAQEIINLP